MSKNVFQPAEIVNLTAQKVSIPAPVFEMDEIEELEEVDEYTGPTADELRQEAEEFRMHWEKEKMLMREAAFAEAEKIKKDAEEAAFEEVRKKTDQVLKEKKDSEIESQRILEAAQAEADKIRAEAQKEADDLKSGFFEDARREGREEGYNEGRDEVKRLVERLHVIINTAIDKRQDIIDQSETQLIELVLLIARKVVKVVTENQKNVVINNIVQALRKMKSRGDVAIHVNLADLELATGHTQDFLKMVENVKSITVLEDSTIDQGGCVIETDFGQIDARISSQLKEIEDKILELVPIKNKDV